MLVLNLISSVCHHHRDRRVHIERASLPIPSLCECYDFYGSDTSGITTGFCSSRLGLTPRGTPGSNLGFFACFRSIFADIWLFLSIGVREITKTSLFSYIFTIILCRVVKIYTKCKDGILFCIRMMAWSFFLL